MTAETNPTSTMDGYGTQMIHIVARAAHLKAAENH